MRRIRESSVRWSIPPCDQNSINGIRRIEVWQINNNNAFSLLGKKLPERLAPDVARVIERGSVINLVEADEIKYAMLVRVLAGHERRPCGSSYRRQYRCQFR